MSEAIERFRIEVDEAEFDETAAATRSPSSRATGC